MKDAESTAQVGTRGDSLAKTNINMQEGIPWRALRLE